MLPYDLLGPRETIQPKEFTARALKGAFLINWIHLSVISLLSTMLIWKMSVNVCLERQNVKNIVTVKQRHKEQVHPSGRHNKKIAAILRLQDEVNHLLYRWERAKWGRHKNSIKTSRSWLSNSKRRSSYFHSLWMLMGKQAEREIGLAENNFNSFLNQRTEKSSTLMNVWP